MTVKELKALLRGVDDDVLVRVGVRRSPMGCEYIKYYPADARPAHAYYAADGTLNSKNFINNTPINILVIE